MHIPRTFISFDFDNNVDHKMLFAGQAKNSRIPFSIADWSSKAPLPQSTWEQKISDKIRKCDLMIVLVGRQTARAIGVEKEIRFAVYHKVPVFGIYIDGAGILTSLPSGLPRNMVTSWSWTNIAEAINIVLKNSTRPRVYS